MIVSVVMSVYNTKIEYLKASVESILHQTFDDFEFIIINDNSNIEVTNYLNSIKDVRVRIFHNDENKGLTKNLNYGIKQAKGKYIARMDADDISHPNRLKKQVEYLNKNLDIGLVGTRGYRFDGVQRQFNVPLNHEDIKAGLITGNTIGHPTVMGRKEIFKEFPYNEKFRTSQDYELWSRIIWSTKVANLPERLFKYRVHKEQVSSQKKEKQENAAIIVRYEILQKISKEFSIEDAKTITKLSSDIDVSEVDFYDYINLSEKIIKNNELTKLYSIESLQKTLSKYLDQTLYMNNLRGTSNFTIKRPDYHNLNIYSFLNLLSKFRKK